MERYLQLLYRTKYIHMYILSSFLPTDSCKYYTLDIQNWIILWNKLYVKTQIMKWVIVIHSLEQTNRTHWLYANLKHQPAFTILFHAGAEFSSYSPPINRSLLLVCCSPQTETIMTLKGHTLRINSAVSLTYQCTVFYCAAGLIQQTARVLLVMCGAMTCFWKTIYYLRSTLGQIQNTISAPSAGWLQQLDSTNALWKWTH